MLTTPGGSGFSARRAREPRSEPVDPYGGMASSPSKAQDQKAVVLLSAERPWAVVVVRTPCERGSDAFQSMARRACLAGRLAGVTSSTPNHLSVIGRDTIEWLVRA